MAQVTITSVGVFSVAKIQGAIAAVFGLIIGVIYGLIIMLFGAALMRQCKEAGGGSIIIGLLAMIGIPVFYGILGFIAGAISVIIYNIAAGIVGGIEIEVEGESQAYSATPPPPPPPLQQHWPAPPPYQQGQGY